MSTQLADATVVIRGECKSWIGAGAGRTSFSTSHAGKVKGKVKWNKGKKEKSRSGDTPFRFMATF